MASKLTKAYIQKAIDKFCEDNDVDGHPEELYDSLIDVNPVLGLKFECEEEHGGYEGAGDECYRVFKVTDIETGQEAYIKYDGYYSSYDGSTYDDGFYIAKYDLVQVKKWKKKGSK